MMRCSPETLNNMSSAGSVRAFNWLAVGVCGSQLPGDFCWISYHCLHLKSSVGCLVHLVAVLWKLFISYSHLILCCSFYQEIFIFFYTVIDDALLTWNLLFSLLPCPTLSQLLI